jgi:GAF domain-containing protein
VHASRLLDSERDADFDRLAQMAARLLSAPAAFVTILDDRRQFIKSATGDGVATKQAGSSDGLDRSLCKHAVLSNEPFVVGDARLHPLAKDNKALEDGIIAYAGIPLESPDGHAIGAICVVDSRPRHWNTEDIENLRVLARSAMRLIAEHHEIAEPALEEVGRSAAERLLLHATEHLQALAQYERLMEHSDAVDLAREAQARNVLLHTGQQLRQSLASDGAAATIVDEPLSEAVRVYLAADEKRDQSARAFREGTGQLASLEAAITAYMDTTDVLRIMILDRGGQL